MVSDEQLTEMKKLREEIIEETKRTRDLFTIKRRAEPGSSLIVLQWNGTNYIVRPESIDPLTFHLYFALQVALNAHRELKSSTEDGHLRLMLALGSVLRCGDVLNQCTSDCKTYGV